MSVPQIPQAATLIRTSPVATSGTGTSSTRTTPFSRKTPARMVLGTGPKIPTLSATVPLALISPQSFLQESEPKPRTHQGTAQVFARPYCFADQIGQDSTDSPVSGRSRSLSLAV